MSLGLTIADRAELRQEATTDNLFSALALPCPVRRGVTGHMRDGFFFLTPASSSSLFLPVHWCSSHSPPMNIS